MKIILAFKNRVGRAERTEEYTSDTHDTLIYGILDTAIDIQWTETDDTAHVKKRRIVPFDRLLDVNIEE